MNLANIGIVIADNNKTTVKIFKQQFSGLPNVQIVRCPLLQISKADCLVCPGNSFGIINDGIEKSITTLLKDLKDRIHYVINSIHYGEQPVGTCIIVDANDKNYSHVAYIPLTRYPSKDIENKNKENINPYLAFRSLLTTVLNHNKINDVKIQTILCPALGVDHGITPDESARQMRIAYGLVDIGITCSQDSATMVEGLLR